ncbi:MSP domain-containing protein [Colletotrichum paranaense]|uniref:MSP domain-containing protein n=4 Tax=Colletotrichum acutatum species complex TaxID=2707335 RepID=A0AAJ0E1N7_9PEZI|nr:MSP domain-containing protein [Colletotrichum costaricense]XP_060349802.1 MSP domain-containing protein [Colletotrichum paranaense]XP_060397002.1 MSP domain-containing protein [Colletotrichum abscissum]KAI3549015.1 MSP domain-containing protein [Colletotrichum filicis]KAK1468580.1 MSP domain-containing protein [Colletotrichum melonis]KAK1479898.1 MSP domain-containing protein [Colletotrichum cuscutae]KAK1716355.1 MSP domain-containing protein [Colletotrichum lupini]KAK1491808.1 MSP domain
MSVEIEPTELSFKRPFTVEVARILRIKNPNQSPIAFKVKTTAPKQYCVRPNSGRVEPGQDVEVTVLLQAMKAEPALDTKCRDKFLVQSVSITADKEFASIANILDQTDKSSLIERKIRVNWLAAEDSVSLNGGSASAVASTPNRQSVVNGDYTPDVSNVYSSPQPDADSGSPAPAARPSTSDVKEDTVSEKAQSTVSAASHVVANTAQVTYEELKQKLSQAEAKIASLQDTSGLRQRVKTETEKLPTAQEAAAAVRQGAEGVSVQIVAILCLFSFLLAYFFF